MYILLPFKTRPPFGEKQWGTPIVGSSAKTESRNNVSLNDPVEAHILAKEAIHQTIS